MNKLQERIEERAAGTAPGTESAEQGCGGGSDREAQSRKGY